MKRQSIYLFALTAILLWSTAGTAFKLALRGMDLIQLLFIASTVAWIFLLAVLVIRKQTGEIRKSTPKNLMRSAFGGFLNPFLYYMILLNAYSVLPAQIAGPLNYTWPIMLVLLSVPFLHQKLKLIEFAAILISFIGVVVISSQGQNIFSTPVNEPVGVILALASSIIWASFWIFNVKDSRPEIIKITMNFFFGSIFTGIALLISSKPVTWNLSVVPAVYVGLTEMAIAFVCWLTALENTKNNARISNLVFISPFISLFFIHLILGEKIYWTTPAGLAFIVGGILIQQLIPVTIEKK
ncbi:MAG: DMT family transporter [Porphyromonadaceae bacterium]|nr:MAG: DMT family transporter [Porphyromonadaceae bacterium]